MKKLIINSDDYGRSPEISRGIREAHLRGVVTSTTCMMNIPTTADDVGVALKETPNLGMGVHLVLTMGKPLSKPNLTKGQALKRLAQVEYFKHKDAKKNG